MCSVRAEINLLGIYRGFESMAWSSSKDKLISTFNQPYANMQERPNPR